MAKKSSDGNWVPTKVYYFAQDATHSRGKKRTRVEAEGSGFNPAKFSAMAETHRSIRERVSQAATRCSRTAFANEKPLKPMEARKEKKQRMELDHFKKMQCSVILKRLMVHRDGWLFKKPVGGKVSEARDCSDIVSRPLMDLDAVKWKLEKDLYMDTRQFADDIRVMFSNAMVCYPMKHEVHKIAKKLRELFEMKWKSMEERWAAEKAKGEEEKPEPLGKVMRKASVGVKACGSVTSKAGKKRKSVSELSREENTCSNSQCQAPSSGLKMSIFDADLSTEKYTGMAMPKQHLLDTILASQHSMCGCNMDLHRKEREAARVAQQKTVRTVFIDDNLKSFQELEQLCGLCLTHCQRVNPLEEILGLILKDEFMSHLEEDKLLSGDWEEGEIIF